MAFTKLSHDMCFDIWFTSFLPFNVRKLNQTAFRIYPEIIGAYGLHSKVFNVETAKKVYFNPGQYLVDYDRLLNAWALLFEQCPGKKTKF